MSAKTSGKSPEIVFFNILCIGIFLFAGCAKGPVHPGPPKHSAYPAGAILSGIRQEAVSYDSMIDDLSSVAVVYVGEQHTRADDHEIQLRIMKSLHHLHPDLTAGMEMFASPYDELLEKWISGKIEEKAFLQKTHWSANWKFDFSLYRPIFEFIQQNHVPLFGLNIPFHVPPKIASGGVDSLIGCEKSYIPERIDLTNSKHREYVRQFHELHSKVGPSFEFENFYAAQVVWEETMAESIERHLNDHPMIVFAGNGHIIFKFGIPERAASRTGKPYRTVMPVPADRPIDFTTADYIFITPAAGRSPHGP